MPHEPTTKRTIAFIDGQNLYHAVKHAFGYTYPNFDIGALGRAVCGAQKWSLVQTRFYTGVPDPTDNAFWSGFWASKLLTMSRSGIVVYSRPLRYRNQRIRLPGGQEHTILTAEEKGIDVRLALDIIRLAHRREFDVALVFSQDQDLLEVADEIRVIAAEQDRWIKMASAFPVSPAYKNSRGIHKTDWVKIDRTVYDRCLDPIDHRP